MAVLEILRRRLAVAEQDTAFGEIWLRVAAPAPPEGAPAP
jgi:hypothetical protein